MSSDSRALDELADRYGTDKRSSNHAFTLAYGSILGPMRNTTRRMLEIGLFWGASLHMWKDFFPIAEIVGMDTFVYPELPWAEPKLKALLTDFEAGRLDRRIQLVRADQSNSTQLATVVEGFAADGRSGHFDVIFDDGSHRHVDQQQTLGFLFRLLRPGGIYVIEDTHTSFKNGFGARARSAQTTVEFIARFMGGDALSSEAIGETQARYLGAWAEGAAVITSPGKRSHESQTTIVYKRAARADRVHGTRGDERPRDVLWRTGLVEADVIRGEQRPWEVTVVCNAATHTSSRITGTQ